MLQEVARTGHAKKSSTKNAFSLNAGKHLENKKVGNLKPKCTAARRGKLKMGDGAGNWLKMPQSTMCCAASKKTTALELAQCLQSGPRQRQGSRAGNLWGELDGKA